MGRLVFKAVPCLLHVSIVIVNTISSASTNEINRKLTIQPFGLASVKSEKSAENIIYVLASHIAIHVDVNPILMHI